jgi:hypothetical protein
MLFFMKSEEQVSLTTFSKIAYGLFVLMVVLEIATTFYQCGLFLC